MHLILKYIFVSGSSYSGNDSDYKCLNIDKNYIENLSGKHFKINNIDYFDGTHSPTKPRRGLSHLIYGSGGAVLDTDIGKISVWGEIEGDININKTHANGAPHINFYFNANFLEDRRKLRKCSITKCKVGLVITKDYDSNIISKCKVENKKMD